MTTPSIAANAYAALSRAAEAGTKGKAAEGSGVSFGSLLKDQLGNMMQAGRASDSQALAMASGKANVVDVVTAVAETEVAVETLVSVRDKVIQAYEEIMRMPI
jgi:flagellar hook-basal body complex protein FliE